MKKGFILFCSCILGIVSFILVSCTDIDLTAISKDVKLQESLVLPVGEDSISVFDIMSKLDFQDVIGYNGDTINFQYEINKEYDFKTIDLLKNAVTKVLSFPLASSVVPANTSIPITGGNEFTVDLGLDPNSTSNRTDSARITTATFAVKVGVTNIKDMSNNIILPADLKIRLVFPKMHYMNNNNAPITKDVSVGQFGAFSDVVITDFRVNTSESTGVPFQVQFLSGNRNINIGSNAKIDIDVKISQLDFAVAYGKYEPTSMEPTIIKMPLTDLSNLPAGLRFANPTGILRLVSNIGTYLRFNIDYIKAFSKDGSTVKQASFNGSPTIVEVVDKKPATPGDSIEKYLHKLDSNYGTTDQLFDSDVKLDTLVYKFSVQTDPTLNNASLTPSFIIPDMKIKTSFKVKIPFYLKSGSNFSLTDTIAHIDKVFDKIDQATLILKVTNALPVKVSYSMKFLDLNRQIINSTINDSTFIINSGEVNSDGFVTKETVTPINLELTTEQIAQLKFAKSMVYSIKVAGQDNSKVIQFKKNDYFKVKLGIFVKSGYSTSLDSIN
jgi:hypothetical protein